MVAKKTLAHEARTSRQDAGSNLSIDGDALPYWQQLLIVCCCATRQEGSRGSASPGVVKTGAQSPEPGQSDAGILADEEPAWDQCSPHNVWKKPVSM